MADLSSIPPLNDYFLHLSQYDWEQLSKVFVERHSSGIGLKEYIGGLLSFIQMCVTGCLGYLTYSISKSNNAITAKQAEIQGLIASIQEQNSKRDSEREKRQAKSDLIKESNSLIEKISDIVAPFFCLYSDLISLYMSMSHSDVEYNSESKYIENCENQRVKLPSYLDSNTADLIESLYLELIIFSKKIQIVSREEISKEEKVIILKGDAEKISGISKKARMSVYENNIKPLVEKIKRA